MAQQNGTAPVKAEFLISANIPAQLPDDDALERAPRQLERQGEVGSSRSNAHGGPARHKRSKEERKALQGSNKGRKFAKTADDLDLCWKIACGEVCENGESCRHGHDIASYLASKPDDIQFPNSEQLDDQPPFVREHNGDHPRSICPIQAEVGYCRYGLKCRFLGAHSAKNDPQNLSLMKELNFVTPETLKLLRSKKYATPITDAYIKSLQEPTLADASPLVTMSVPEPEQESEHIASTGPTELDNGLIDTPIRFAEKKRLHWKGKTYLAPLTTVGNLPFRRLCVSYGADITCGEMGLATSFLSGSREEWSLVRRHPSERIFGVQVAGNKPHTLVSTAEILARELNDDIDFVDLNCGCPIDLVFRTGSGSALLDTPGKLGKIIIGMNKALGSIPLTVKLRTGVKDGKNTAHNLMPRLSTEWSACCMTLHGRTRQQRYTKLADWDYIKTCVDAVRAREADHDLPPVPIFGGGDVYSSQDYWSCLERTGVDGIMIGRGALIKPWIFTEIKERREWDISSRERLEMIRQLAEYGLSHFGSDTSGVNTARRYLCESLSFQYRYVPIGLLERLPARLNDRPPAFRGRNDLETLLASGSSADWVKISGMFLGPAPESWKFTPKHKSNSYESQG